MLETIITRGIETGGWLFPFLAGSFAILAAVALRRRRSPIRYLAAAVGAAFVLAFACAGVFAADVRNAIVHRSEDFSFRLLDGTEHHLRDYRGKVVLLNFWATWCGACQTEMPDLERLARERAQDAVVIAVSDEPIEDLRKAVPADVYRLNGAFSDVAPEGTAAKMAYAGRPSTLVIDKQGRIRKVLVGLHDHAEFEAALRSAL